MESERLTDRLHRFGILLMLIFGTLFHGLGLSELYLRAFKTMCSAVTYGFTAIFTGIGD